MLLCHVPSHDLLHGKNSLINYDIKYDGKKYFLEDYIYREVQKMIKLIIFPNCCCLRACLLRIKDNEIRSIVMKTETKIKT